MYTYIYIIIYIYNYIYICAHTHTHTHTEREREREREQRVRHLATGYFILEREVDFKLFGGLLVGQVCSYLEEFGFKLKHTIGSEWHFQLLF